ncbi:MAG: adenylyl-sulfate kinase [Gemmatimonadaceae bacterium]|jgi:alpha-galactosidase|nr:adenylyl-sulfate kinase [Gemmatimonadaceae bacterium]
MSNPSHGSVAARLTDWQPPTITDLSHVPTGDMPGDKVVIGEQHVAKATTVFRALVPLVQPMLDGSAPGKAVIAVHGGSGVGKSEVGSLLAHYFNALEISAYVMSGDNYPHRIPKDNDHERLLVFREAALKGLVAAGEFTHERNAVLHGLQAQEQDANPAHVSAHPWLAAYQAAGRTGLMGYLGTPRETDFAEVSRLLAEFKAGRSPLMLKRMGRDASTLWYDAVDMSRIRVLVIEWTHGNNDHLHGVDIPILLNSTPQETLAHRRARNRDGAVDSPFTTMVLEIEQGLLASQAHKAKLIVSKAGDIVSHADFTARMAAEAAAQ